MPDHFENNLGHIVFNNVSAATDYMANTADTASYAVHDWMTNMHDVREWIANMHNEWNQAQENITYRDAETWSSGNFYRARPNWSEVFSPLVFVSSADKNEDIEEENELLDEFLNEFVVKGDDDK